MIIKGGKIEMPKKNYKTILREDSKNHTLDYLLGYIRCLASHNLIHIEEAMKLIDYVIDLILEKKGIKL